MKELLNDAKPDLESPVQQQQMEKKRSYLKRIDGGTIFEYNTGTKEIKEAQYITIEVGGNPRLSINPGCLYVEALNLQNAQKRVKKGKFI